MAGDPVAVELRHRVGGAGMKGRRLLLGNLLHLSEKLRGGGLVNPRGLPKARHADCLQNPQDPDSVRVGRVLRLLKGDGHMGLGRQVVDLVWADLQHQADQVHGIRHVPVDQMEAVPLLLPLLQKMGDTLRRVRGAPAEEPIDLISLLQQKFRQIGSVLSRDTCNQSCLAHSCMFLSFCPSL